MMFMRATVFLEFALFLFAIVHSEGPPSIIGTVKPQYTVIEGQTLKLRCEVTGTNDPPVSRTLTAWKKLPEGLIIRDEFPRFKIRLGKYLRIKNVKLGDRGTYVCSAWNPDGKLTRQIRLVVLEANTISRATNIVTNPPTALRTTTIEPSVKTTNSPLLIGSPTPIGTTSLPVGRPPEFTNPSNRSSQYTQGSTIRLKCHVNGKLSFNVTWLKNGRRLGKAERKLLKSKGRVLHFQKLSPSQAGFYMCIVENELGRIVKAFDVKVFGMEREHKPRILDKALKNETANSGDDATFVCSAVSKSYPDFNFLKWKGPESVSKVNFRISKFREIREVAKPLIGRGRMYTHRLIIHNVTSADEAKYTCVVRNSAGWASRDVFLTVDEKEYEREKPEVREEEHSTATKEPSISEAQFRKEIPAQDFRLAAIICVAVVSLLIVTIIWCYFITRKRHCHEKSMNEQNAFRHHVDCNAQRHDKARNVGFSVYVERPNNNLQSHPDESVSKATQKVWTAVTTTASISLVSNAEGISENLPR